MWLFILAILLFFGISFFRFTFKDRENDSTSYIIVGGVVLIVIILLLSV